MKYIANPVEVSAYQIDGVSLLADGRMVLALADAPNFVCEPEMLARYVPVNGDYLVMQADGYTYLNPRDVFERKYHRA